MVFSAIQIFNTSRDVLHAMHEMFGLHILIGIEYMHFLFWMSFTLISINVRNGSWFEGPEGGMKIKQQFWVIDQPLRHDHEEEPPGISPDSQCSQWLPEDHKDPSTSVSKALVRGVQVPVRKTSIELERRQFRSTADAMLFRTVFGFALVNATGSLQTLEVFQASAFAALIPVGINILMVVIFFRFYIMTGNRALKGAKTAEHSRYHTSREVRACWHYAWNKHKQR